MVIDSEGAADEGIWDRIDMPKNVDSFLIGSVIVLIVVMVIRILLVRRHGLVGGRVSVPPPPRDAAHPGMAVPGRDGTPGGSSVTQPGAGGSAGPPDPVMSGAGTAAPRPSGLGEAAAPSPEASGSAAGTSRVEVLRAPGRRSSGPFPTTGSPVRQDESRVVPPRSGPDTAAPGSAAVAGPSSQPSHPSPGKPGATTGGKSGDLVSTIHNPLAETHERVDAIRRFAEMCPQEAVDHLIRILYDPDPEIASAAAEGLGMIGDPRAIDAMIEISKTLDEKLIRAGGDEPVASPQGAGIPGAGASLPAPFDFEDVGRLRPDLLPARYHTSDGGLVPRKALVSIGLSDTDLRIRQMAARAAIGSKDPDLLLPLVQTVENRFEAESVRFLAAKALGEMGDDRALKSLLGAVTDENPAVRYAAAEALGHYRSERSLEALLASCRDQDQFVRSAVAHALGQIGTDQAIEALLGSLDDQSEVVRYTATDALSRLPNEDLVDRLGRRMAYASSALRQALIDALASRSSDPRAFDLLRSALRDPDPDVRFKASLALMNQESVEALDDLIGAAKELDAELLGYARSEGVPWVGGNGVEPPAAGAAGMGAQGGVASAAQRPSVAGSAAAFGAAENAGDGQDAVNRAGGLAALARDLGHEDFNVRSCAAVVLAEVGDPVAADLLGAALDDEHELVRSSAISSLARVAGAAALDRLLPKTDDPSDEVRYALVTALERIGGMVSRGVLERMARNDNCKRVRQLARQAIDRMNG